MSKAVEPIVDRLEACLNQLKRVDDPKKIMKNIKPLAEWAKGRIINVIESDEN